MDPLDDQRRYLAAAHAAAAAAPDVHACQVVALDRERAIAAAVADGAAYRAASGDLFETVRAAWLDRLVAHARVAAGLDDPWTVRAAAIEIAATLAARGHADWTATLAAGSAAAAVWHDRAATARTAPAAIIGAVVRAAWDRREATRVEAAATADAAWAGWAAVEPALAGGAALATLFARPRLALRTPWSERGVAALLALVAADGRRSGALVDAAGGRAGAGAAPRDGGLEVPDAASTLAAIDADVARWRAGLAHAPTGPVVGGEPDVAAVVAPYAGLVALPGDEPTTVALRTAARRLVAHARGATTAQGVMAAWTEAGLLADFAAAPVRAHAGSILARTERWPDPVLAAGARALLDDLSGIRTGTEVDLISMHHGACAAIEADWNYALGGALFAPLLAAAIAGWDPAGAGGLAASWRIAHDLAGAGAGLLAVPRLAPVLTLIAGHAALPPDLGAWLGEIGHDVVVEARTWFGVRGLGVATAAEVAGLLEAAWGRPPVAAPRPLRLWGQAVALDALGTVVPARPPVPGRSRPAAS